MSSPTTIGDALGAYGLLFELKHISITYATVYSTTIMSQDFTKQLNFIFSLMFERNASFLIFMKVAPVKCTSVISPLVLP